MSSPDWQILVCSVWARTGYLEPLLCHLSTQAAPYGGRVEVVVDRDNGQATVGAKRTRLLEQATGRYISYVDDDDWVSDDYVARVMLALTEKPDAVGFNLSYEHHGRADKIAIHSRRHTDWSEDTLAYYRTINHLNPVKRQCALWTLPFKDGFGEDMEYARRLAPYIRSEVFLDGEPVYRYRYSPATSLFASGSRYVRFDPPLEVPAYVHLLSDHGAG